MAGTPTETPTAPSPTPPPPRPPAGRRAPVLLAAAVTAGWAAIVSYASVLAVVALLVMVSGGARVPAVLRFGTGGWLLAHGVPLHTGAGPLGLVPLAVSVLAGWRVNRAGVHTVRAIGARRSGSMRLAALAAGCVALAYGLIGAAAAAAAARDPEWSASPLLAGLTFGGFALLAAAPGAAVESGVAARLWRRLPPPLRDGARTGLVAALLVLGAGAAVAGVTIAVAGGDASATIRSYHTGIAGQAGLTLLCLVFAPNLAAWAMAYLVGPGFAVGVGTTVSAATVRLGALPAVPVLTALPTTPVSGLTAPLLGLPLAAGMAAGALLARRQLRQARVPGWGPLLAGAVLAGPVAGLLLGLTAWASGGPLGSGRLAQTGPSGLPVALVATGVVAVGALIGAATMRVLQGGAAGTGKVRS